jgi:hypothetical protein
MFSEPITSDARFLSVGRFDVTWRYTSPLVRHDLRVGRSDTWRKRAIKVAAEQS